jgi:hypothetical protein
MRGCNTHPLFLGVFCVILNVHARLSLMQTGDKCSLPWASCELLVAFKLAEQGYAISTPLQPQPYDLVVDTGEVPARLLRVQVKKASLRPQRMRRNGKGDRSCYRIALVRHRAGRQKLRLRVHMFDYLVVVCTPVHIYVVPTAVLQRHDSGELVEHLEFKPQATNGREDSALAGLRWLPYLNQFTLTVPLDTL